MSSRRRKAARIKEGTKGGETSQNGKEELRKPQKLPLTLSMYALPLRYTLSCFFSQQSD
jgi:hypothetical protein